MGVCASGALGPGDTRRGHLPAHHGATWEGGSGLQALEWRRENQQAWCACRLGFLNGPRETKQPAPAPQAAGGAGSPSTGDSPRSSGAQQPFPDSHMIRHKKSAEAGRDAPAVPGPSTRDETSGGGQGAQGSCAHSWSSQSRTFSELSNSLVALSLEKALKRPGE